MSTSLEDWERSAATHDPHLAVEVQRPCLARSPWYIGDGADVSRYRVIDKGISSVDQQASPRICAPPV